MCIFHLPDAPPSSRCTARRTATTRNACFPVAAITRETKRARGNTCVALPTFSFLFFLPNLRRNSHPESHLHLFLFFCMYITTFRKFCHSSSLTSKIRKSTTPRSTHWCSHYIQCVKRQQFSCPLGTAAWPLKFENVVFPVVAFLLSHTVPSIFFTAPPSTGQYSYVRIFRKVMTARM